MPTDLIKHLKKGSPRELLMVLGVVCAIAGYDQFTDKETLIGLALYFFAGASFFLSSLVKAHTNCKTDTKIKNKIEVIESKIKK